MSIKNNTTLMTVEQIKRQLKFINIDEANIKQSLFGFIEQFECLDKTAKSIGLIKNEFSFVNRVSWEPVLLALATSSKNREEEINLKDISEAVSQSSNQIENEIIPKLKKLRNNWMTEVILIEFVILGLVALVFSGITHVLGLWSLSNVSFSVQPLLYERPIFSFITVFVLFVGFVGLHFNTRAFVARQTVRKLKKENSEFDLVSAFLKNTGFMHSIFSPDIVGFGWLNRKCLQMSQN